MALPSRTPSACDDFFRARFCVLPIVGARVAVWDVARAVRASVAAMKK
jgi:hypothetical protein